MAFEHFIDGFSNEEIRELARRLQANEVSAPLEAELFEQLEATSMEQRQAAFEEKPAILDLLVALGLEFTFPDGELGGPDGEEIEEAENGLGVEEAEPPPAPQPQREGQRGPPGRPSPFGNNADKDLARRFFGGNLMKGQAWVSAEQERLSRFQGLEPDEFWSQFGADVWGADLTRQEFLNPGL